MKIKHQLSIATLVMAGVFATGCSQQSAGGSQVSGGSQSSGGSQVSGGSQQQVEGGSQVASDSASGASQQSAGGSQVADNGSAAGGSQQSGSQQQVEEAPVVAPVAKVTPRPVAPAPVKVAPRRPAGNCHGHAANARTKSMRHCHPNPTASHRYGGQRRAAGGNRWGHTHPAIPNCTKSISHTHKYQNARHSHKYSCQGMRPAPRRAAAAKQPVDVYALQRKLKAKGYYKGPIDGIVGSGTRSALKRFMNR